jgi:diguanylate cyclase (GGDEF)-like protein
MWKPTVLPSGPGVGDATNSSGNRVAIGRWVRDRCARRAAYLWPVAGDLVAATAAIVLARTGHGELPLAAIFMLLTGVVCLASFGTGTTITSGRAACWSALLVISTLYAAVVGQARYETFGVALALGVTLGLGAATLRRRDALLSSLREASCRDLLTGLANRRLLHDRLDLALARARQQKQLVGVLYLDLDGFKAVNDALGHAAGDLLLRQVAERLAGRIRAGDTLGRLGGDEFACVLIDLSRSTQALIVARDLLRVLQEPFMLLGQPWSISASIGISVYPDDGQDGDQLLQQADSAMYQVKRRCKGACGNFHDIPGPGQQARNQIVALAPGPSYPAPPFGDGHPSGGATNGDFRTHKPGGAGQAAASPPARTGA